MNVGSKTERNLELALEVTLRNALAFAEGIGLAARWSRRNFGPGFGERRIETDDDVADVVALMRLNCDRVVARNGLPEVAGRRR